MAVSLGSVVAEDMATDGRYWYAACGANGIKRGTTSSGAWSAIQARSVSYAGNRICATYRGSGSSTPNVWSTLNDSGAEEVASGRLILPTGWTITKSVGGSGYVWFGAYTGNVGVIYRWQVGSSDAPSIAMELPAGQVPLALCWYQGQVLVRARRRRTALGDEAVLYRCPIDTTGALTPFVVVELEGDAATSMADGDWAAQDRLVFFGWPDMQTTGAPGIGAIDLSTGGYAKWHAATSDEADRAVTSIVAWQDRVAFVVPASATGGTDGRLFYEADTYLTSGWLKTSVSDKASTLTKVFDSVTVVAEPLAGDESIETSYSHDDGVSYLPLATATLTGAGSRSVTAAMAGHARTVSLRFELNGPGTSTPTLRFAQVRLHLLGPSDRVLQIPIDCGDRVSDLRQKQLAENGPGKGAQRARALEALEQTRVRFQDVDWPTTQEAAIYEVLNVDVRSVGVYDRSVGRQALRQVAVLTLRKAAS